MGSDTDVLVSWQSAFWGVLLIAVNTFLQRPGSILPSTGDDPEDDDNDKIFPDRVLRASPFVCLVDALDLFVRTAVHLARGDSFRKAARDILAHRGLGHLEVGTEQPQFQRIWALRVMAAVFAFIQLLKLCGMRGIPWSAFSGCCYFADWICLEILDAAKTIGVSSQHELPQPLASERLLSRVKKGLVLLASFLSFEVLFWMYGHLILVQASVIGLMLEQGTYYQAAAFGTFISMLVLAIFLGVFFVTIPTFLELFYETKRSEHVIYSVVASLPAITLLCHAYVVDHSLGKKSSRDYPQLSGNWTDWKSIYWFMFAGWPVLCTCSVAAPVVTIVTSMICAIGKGWEIRTLHALWGVLLSCSLAVVLLHYAWRQDFSQTSKPAWVEWLG